jgi:hypothetical protein
MQPSDPTEKTYQMLWDCRFCNTQKLLGVDHRHCPNCGAAQDVQWRYFPSEADKKVVDDPKYVYTGIDKLCPFCSQPNSAAAKYCKDCGGDLANAKHVAVKDSISTVLGEDVAGKADDVVRQRFEKEQLASKPQSRRTQIILAVLATLCIGLIGAFLFLSNSTYASTVTVNDLKWERTISVETYSAVPGSDWRDSVPVGAYNTSCLPKDRPHDESYQEACGVERVDRGDGSFVEKQKMCTKSRTVYKPDTFCSYTVNLWIKANDLKTAGGPNEPLSWANFTPSVTNNIGAQREARRQQNLIALFTDKSGKQYEYALTEQNEEQIWRSFKIGQQYTLEVNRLEVPQWQTLKLAEPR